MGTERPGSGFFQYVEQCIPVINRANYTIQYVEQNDSSRTECRNQSIFEAIDAENYFLRALAYFRLVQNWGDVSLLSPRTQRQ